MFNWTLAFFLAAVLASVLGLGGVALVSGGIGNFLFFSVASLMVLTLVLLGFLSEA